MSGVSPSKLPLLVAAIIVPIAFAFYLGGPGVGVAVGSLVAVAIVVIAVGQRPRGTIEPVAGGSKHRRVLVVVADPLEDPEAVERVAASVGPAEAAQVMVLAPAKIGFLDRWSSDVEGARRDAQRRLVLSVASLATAGIEAEGRVGDEDVVQAVEDQLGSFSASEVILVSTAGGGNAAGLAAADELRARLRVPFRLVSAPAAH